jgi:hypothetical protein
MLNACQHEKGDFLELWGKFYGLPYRGVRFEIDRKDAVQVQGHDILKSKPEYDADNCVLACALCNMSKSNMFTHEEFHEVGKVIEEIWRKRKEVGLKVKKVMD